MHTKYCAIIMVFLSAFLTNGCAHPDDAVLRSIFVAKRQVFLAVVKMLGVDATMQEITPTNMKAFYRLDPKQGIPVEGLRISDIRWDTYKKAFAEIGCSGGIATDFDHRAIVFYFSVIGTAFDNTCKGIAYIPRPLPRSYHLVTDLNHQPIGGGTFIAKLEGDWYLYFEE